MSDYDFPPGQGFQRRYREPSELQEWFKLGRLVLFTAGFVAFVIVVDLGAKHRREHPVELGPVILEDEAGPPTPGRVRAQQQDEGLVHPGDRPSPAEVEGMKWQRDHPRGP